MVRLGRFTQKELRFLDKKSTENMLTFYEEEMKRIAEGESPSHLLTKPLIDKFVKFGFLVHSTEGKRRGKTLSRKGREFYGLPPRRSLPPRRKRV